MNTLKSAYNNFNENVTASVYVNSFTYSLNKLTNQDIMLPIKAMTGVKGNKILFNIFNIHFYCFIYDIIFIFLI